MTYKKTNKLSQLCIGLIFLAGSLSVSANDNPTISELLAVNKCNYSKSVGLDNTILFEIEGSESLMKPVVTILGERANVVGNWTGAVDVNGSAKKWKAEFPVLGPETVDANLKLFISDLLTKILGCAAGILFIIFSTETVGKIRVEALISKESTVFQFS